MIRTSLCLYDFHTFILAQFPNNHPDIRSNLPIYHLSSIFWGEDYMILTVPFCVGQAVCFFFFFITDIPPITMYLRLKARQPAVSFSASLPKLLE